MDEQVFHYTDCDGWNGIRSQMNWLFRANTPPGHLFGAYFTPCPPNTQNLHRKLGNPYPKAKREYAFAFHGREGLVPAVELGGRAAHVWRSPVDYRVERPRQQYADLSSEWRARP
jgi:hypothetical protein